MINALLALMISSNPGVVIVDNVLFYGDDSKMRILNTGDMVDITEDVTERYKVRYDTVFGEFDKNVLVDLNSEIGEHELFVFARGYFDDGEYEKAARLLEIFTSYFDASNYLAEAMYYLGQSFEAIASRNDSLAGIERNESLHQNYYSGDIYRVVVIEFPDSPYASKAQYRLINIYRIKHLPWHDSVQVIEQELAMWHEFCEKYPDTDEHVMALSEMGYLNRVLYEITKSDELREAASAIFEGIIMEYPNSVYAAYAIVHLHELAVGEQIYKY
jgi:outer membrane protein assembly factor BamD (BamD/ComL family)